MAELIGRVIDGKYRLVRLLGEGGMAQVFEAEHTVLSRRVAVKILRSVLTSTPDAMNRFLLEAKTAAKLDHPNVVQVHDVGVEDDGLIFIVMEVLRGKTLSELIDEKGRLPALRVVPIILQVLSALNAAHSLGIIHRDLKPDNVFLAVDARMREEVKLLDFGIAKIQGTEDVDTKLTRTGMVMGTPHYLSPEQARGGKDIDARIDIWSVGVMMYEMLSGRIAFDGTSYNEVLGNILMEPPTPLIEVVPNIPPNIVAVVEKAMAKDRELRYPSVTRMIRDLMPMHDHAGYEMSTVVVQALHDTVPPTPAAGTDTQQVELPPVLSLTPSAGTESFDDLATLVTPKPWTYRVPFIAWPALGVGLAVLGIVAFLSLREPEVDGPATVSTDVSTAVVRDPGLATKSEATAEEESDEPEPELPSATVNIGVEGLPAAAQIFVSGKAVTLPLSLPRANQPVILKVQARGFESFEKALVPDRDQTVTVVMASKKTTSSPRSGTDDEASPSEPKRDTKTTKKNGKVWAKNPFGE